MDFRDISMLCSVYYAVMFLPDPPPAECVILTDELVQARIDKFLSEDKYTEVLKLDVEQLDEEGLRNAEEKRRERDSYIPPKIVETSTGKGKGKKKSKIY